MATRKTTQVPAKRSPGAMEKAKQVIGTILGSDLVKIAAATALVGAAKALADRRTATLKGAAKGAAEAVGTTAATAARQVGENLGGPIGGSVGEAVASRLGAMVSPPAEAQAMAADKPRAKKAAAKKPRKTAAKKRKKAE